MKAPKIGYLDLTKEIQVGSQPIYTESDPARGPTVRVFNNTGDNFGKNQQAYDMFMYPGPAQSAFGSYGNKEDWIPYINYAGGIAHVNSDFLNEVYAQ